MRISDWSSDVCSSDLPGGYRRWPGQCAGSLHRPAGRQEFRQAYRPGRGPLSHCPVRADDSRDKKEMTMTTNSSPALQGSILVSGVGSLQGVGAAIARRFGREGYPVRSEEHTSALQSLMSIPLAVVCLTTKNRNQ